MLINLFKRKKIEVQPSLINKNLDIISRVFLARFLNDLDNICYARGRGYIGMDDVVYESSIFHPIEVSDIIWLKEEIHNCRLNIPVDHKILVEPGTQLILKEKSLALVDKISSHVLKSKKRIRFLPMQSCEPYFCHLIHDGAVHLRFSYGTQLGHNDQMLLIDCYIQTLTLDKGEDNG